MFYQKNTIHVHTWSLFLKVFDILPLYGMLQPGDTEQVTMTFFGHADIWGQAKAICEVEGGPTYEIMLKGEASLVDYRFDCREIEYGKQVCVSSFQSDDICCKESNL